MSKLLILFISVLFCSYNQNQIRLDNSTDKVILDQYVYLFVDSNKQHTISDLKQQPDLFKPANNSDLLFGYTDAVIWLRLTISNQTSDNWHLSLTTSNLRFVDFFRVDSTGVEKTETGFYRPFKQREVDFVDFSFVIKPQQTGEKKDFYLRIENVGRTDIPLSLQRESDYLQETLKTQFVFGLFYGLLLIMIGYNLILAFTLRDKGYLNYSLFLFCFTVAMSALDTVFQQYIMPESPLIAADIFRISMYFCVIFALNYTNDLLGLKREQPGLFKLLSYLKIVILLNVLITVFYYNILIANILVIASCSIMIYSGIVQWRTGYHPAKTFVIAWTIFLLSVILLTLPIGMFTLNFLRIGMALMVMLLSIALSDRIRILRQEKLKIQENLVNEKDRMLRIKDELNESLKHSMTELESKNTELEQFTYTVSHDLKNPLFTISSYLGQLRDDAIKGDKEAIERDLNYIKVATSTMGNLLEDLLNLSRIGYKMNPSEPVNIGELIDNSLHLFAKQIDELNIKIERQHIYPTVFADHIRLYEVFQNLIANAIKFTRQDVQNVIKIKTEEVDDIVRCTISDNGIGIDPQYKERVFTLFEQLNPNGAGTGIGLSIVKRIIEIHGGQIKVESEGLNKGSAFIFELPKAN